MDKAKALEELRKLLTEAEAASRSTFDRASMRWYDAKAEAYRKAIKIVEACDD